MRVASYQLLYSAILGSFKSYPGLHLVRWIVLQVGFSAYNHRQSPPLDYLTHFRMLFINSLSHGDLTHRNDGWVWLRIPHQRSTSLIINLYRPGSHLLHRFFILHIFKRFSFCSTLTESNRPTPSNRRRATIHYHI